MGARLTKENDSMDENSAYCDDALLRAIEVPPLIIGKSPTHTRICTEWRLAGIVDRCVCQSSPTGTLREE